MVVTLRSLRIPKLKEYWAGASNESSVFPTGSSPSRERLRVGDCAVLLLDEYSLSDSESPDLDETFMAP